MIATEKSVFLKGVAPGRTVCSNEYPQTNTYTGIISLTQWVILRKIGHVVGRVGQEMNFVRFVGENWGKYSQIHFCMDESFKNNTLYLKGYPPTFNSRCMYLSMFGLLSLRLRANVSLAKGRTVERGCGKAGRGCSSRIKVGFSSSWVL